MNILTGRANHYLLWVVCLKEGLVHDLAALELKVAPRACADIDERTMCAFKGFFEEFHMQLLQRWPLIPVSAWQATVVCRCLHRARSFH